MNINKKEIIDELISIEPDLLKNKENLDKILENFILSKPEIKISTTFKKELKNSLLLEIDNIEKINKKNNYISIKNIISFIMGGVVTYSILGIIGVNFINISSLNRENTDLFDDNIIVESNQFVQENDMMLKSKSSGFAEPMLMQADIQADMQEDLVGDLKYYDSIRNILYEMGFENEKIDQIIEFIKKLK